MKSTDRRTYFSFGQNCLPAVMRQRAPGASLICSGRIDDRQWIITPNGYASIVPKARSAVFGMLWSITATDEHGLDLAEGVSFGAYVKKKRKVVSRCAQSISALVYEVPSSRIGRHPQRGYIEGIIEALSADDFIPAAYLKELATWLR